MENIISFSKPVACGPCEKRSCVMEKHECMDIITVEEVFDAVKAWITA
jgi:ADP-heptose:LPS heptosyltransferase